jgi:hypothetical protein
MLASKCRTCILGFLVSSGVWQVLGQTSPSDGGPIKLTATTSDVRYCETDAEIYTEQFLFDTEYANSSDRPLTLALGSEVLTKTMVAANRVDWQRRKLELQMDLESYPTDAAGSSLLGEDLRAEKIVVVAPGESVRSKIRVSVPVRHVSHKIPGTVASGRHVLVIEVAIKSQKSGTRQAGIRWLTSESQPIQIDAPMSPRLSNCSK